LARPDAALDTEYKAYLPDFCSAGTIFVVLLVAELVAIALTLAAVPAPGQFLVELGETSLFALWFALLASAILCRMRGRVERLGKLKAFIVSFVLLQALSLLLSEAAWQLTRRFSEVAVIEGSHANFLVRTFAISCIVIALGMRYLYVSSEWQRSIALEAQSRVSALQALIRPHFLFNSLNTIAALSRSDPARAEEAVEDLADLMRANLGGARDRATLREEIEIAALYERIEKLRLGDRLQIKWDLDELPLHALLPSLTLQPLIENAIYHGVELVPEGGEVKVTGTRRNGKLHIEITNPRPREPASDRRRAGNRMALANIRERFELAWGGRGGVTIDERPDSFTVRLEFPLDEATA
jgi:two-component system sensor histidine kinase AlgZ